MLQQTNTILRTILLGGAVLIAGWWTVFLRGQIGEHERALAERDGEIEELGKRVEQRDDQIRELGETLQQRNDEIRRLGVVIEEKDAEIEALDVAMKLLKVDHRLAEIEVISQGSKADEPDKVRTLMRFTEVSQDGEPLAPPIEATIEGRTVYVETLVIKFGDEYVERGDALRGTSICLFRRLFGEDQQPSAGVPIDSVGTQPLIYGGDDTPDPLYRDLWSRFWEYANDPELARSRGVRALHGEAPFIEVQPGKRYRVELRSSGGLTIRPEPD